MAHIILLNGAPRSGKDTLATYLNQVHDYRHEKFAYPLRRYMYSVHGMNAQQFEEQKDSMLPELNNHTPREMVIKFCEQHLKPIFGSGVLGQMLARRIRKHRDSDVIGDHSYVISDLGFLDELLDLHTQFKKDFTFLVVRLHREGHDFKSDSRGHINPMDFTGIRVVDVHVQEDDVPGTAESIVEYIEHNLIF